MIYFQSLTRPELIELLRPLDEGKAKYRAEQIFKWVYQRHVTEWSEMTDLAKNLRAWLSENVEIYRLPEKVCKQAADGTRKFLWNLHDQKTIESVIIPAALDEKSEEFEGVESGNPSADQADSMYSGHRHWGFEDLQSERWGRLTACISSQVGCAMACRFCLTGVQGLDRNLETHEIVAQIHELRRRAPITNIVFMGMGEPMHNLDNVIRACRIFLDPSGFGFSKRKITVSTSGLVPGIERLGKEIDVSLAISLNASTDEQRSELMPVNKRWDLGELLAACRRYPLGPHRRITFEYVMFRDINDSLDDAARVAKLLRGIPSKVNLIPLNEHAGSAFRRPTDERVRTFQRYLLDRGFTATVRVSRGRDILAACGQLRSVFGTARGTDRHQDWPAVQAAAHDA